jgi:hypothetical protein
MSLTDALHDWKHLAATAFELNTLKKQVTDLQTAHDNAKIQFEEELEDLEEEERESILSIMAVYDQSALDGASSEAARETSGPRSTALQWLVNKIGNEGTEGITWADILDAWKSQYPDSSTSVVYATLCQHKNLFVKNGLGKRAVLRLTADGQSVFRDGT